MRVTISPLAERDLHTIGDFIAPQAYRLRPELGKGVRSCAHGDYVIFFTATKQLVIIVRILHGAMNIPIHFRGE